MIAARFVVRGRVQGVAFRAHARAEALRLGLTGSACNRDDGSVDVLACGNEAAIDTFEDGLRRGPPLARVDALSREAVEAVTVRSTGFDIG